MKSHKLAEIDLIEVRKIASKMHGDNFTILLINENDDGEKSPFTVKSYQIYLIDLDKEALKLMGEGSCQYNNQIGGVEMMLIVLKVFILSIKIQPILKITKIIKIPGACQTAMSYLICPFAFLLGVFMPYFIVKICYFLGFALPDVNSDFIKSLHWIAIIFLIIRYSPTFILSSI